MITMRRMALILGVLFLGACNLEVSTGAPNDPSDPATETFASSLHIDLSTMQKTAQGVYYKDLVVGGGTELDAVGYVDMQYAAYLKDGSLFDAGEPTQYNLALSPVGLQDGMVGMKVGGERVIVIPSALGFGNNTFPGVPANSTLIYDVALTQIY